MDGRWELDEETLGGYSILFPLRGSGIVQAESHRDLLQVQNLTHDVLLIEYMVKVGGGYFQCLFEHLYI